ncbi:TatD family hydrolase [Dysgonomonas sp. GY617]|uniref:TatD family hydrolase n=1 Tax=Dysgonomonas sp. GY617 TaxID=2780420 RepID=UPI0018847CE5|nr:TatD family hydrolase [Dysgonomonas sp. GY617]MBF0577598.1 TatD family hydrolase [Dysgonomonas sp. GY617]
MANLYDTHFHLDLQESRNDILNLIEINKVYTIAVTNLPPLYEKLSREVDNKYIRIALGFHPELIGQYQKYIPDMWRLLPNAKYIGEVGVDLKTGKDYKNLQISFFEELINRCNVLGGKILSVHSRSAASEVTSIIGDNFNGKIVLHWYSGTKRIQEKALESGFYFSVNYTMLNSESGRKIITNIPNDRLLIETDSPFTFINKCVFSPKDIGHIVESLAQMKNLDYHEIKDILWQNFVRLIS